MDLKSILEVSDSYQIPNKLMDIIYDKEEREKLFIRLLEENDYKVGYDWFTKHFEDEHADRKVKKQDFTPKSVANLLSKLALCNEGDAGNYYEVAAGTGSILINHWNNYRMTYSPFDYEPKYHFAFVEELSDRAIPFLLVNMMIRGMNGIVLHCDSLTRECKNAYFICNTENDHFKFSGITNIPHNEMFEKESMVKFISKEYIEHKELMDLDILNKL